jgi:hypothetical protein
MSNLMMENLHKHLYRFMIVDLLLCFFIISTYSISATICFIVIFIIPFFGIISFKNKKSGGDLMALVLLLVLSFVFLLSGLIELGKDDTMNTIQGFLLILLSLSTLRRVKTIREPAYKNWYYNTNEDLSDIRENISEDEILATCPSCATLLAVVPMKLSIEDKCPNCNANLVNLN